MDTSELSNFATVYSGRNGIDPEEVSRGLSEIFGTRVPERFHQRNNTGRYHMAVDSGKIALSAFVGELKVSELTFLLLE